MAMSTRTAVGLGAAVVGFGAGSAAAYWCLSRRTAAPPAAPSSADDGTAVTLLSHPALKYGLPVSDAMRVLTNIVISYDTRLRNPKWVIEHFTSEKLRGDGNRTNSAFYEDPEIDARFRSKLSDYRRSGYDRGHLAPAANHRSSQQTMDETFNLANTAPQVGPGFNRDMWARLERFVYELGATCTDVYVVTGPLYLPQRVPGGKYVMRHDMIGTPPQLVAVPTHFYKIVLGELRRSGIGDGGQVAIGAFVMPNQQIDPDTPLAAFAVPPSALEEVAGVRFFPGYLNEERRLALDEASLAVQRRGQAELRRLKPDGNRPLLLPGPPPPGGQLPPPRRGPGGHGAIHVCEHKACELPPPNWWEEAGKKEGKLRRSKSASKP